MLLNAGKPTCMLLCVNVSAGVAIKWELVRNGLLLPNYSAVQPKWSIRSLGALQPSSTRARKGHHSPQQLFHFLPRVLSTELMRGRCWRYYGPQKGRNAVRKNNQRNTSKRFNEIYGKCTVGECAVWSYWQTPDYPWSPRITNFCCVCAHNFFGFLKVGFEKLHQHLCPKASGLGKYTSFQGHFVGHTSNFTFMSECSFKGLNWLNHRIHSLFLELHNKAVKSIK